MHKAVYTLLYISFALFSLPSAFGADRPRVGIIEFTAIGVAAADASAVTERFRMELVNYKKYDVLERDSIDRILKNQDLQKTGCAETACALKLGRIINAEYMIYGSAIRLGSAYFITASMVNITTGQIEKSGQVRVDRPDDVQKPVLELVRTLIRDSRRAEIAGSKPGEALSIVSIPPAQTQPLGLFEDVLIHGGYNYSYGYMHELGFTENTWQYGIEYAGRNLFQPTLRISGMGPFHVKYDAADTYYSTTEVTMFFGAITAGVRWQPVLGNSIFMGIAGVGAGVSAIYESATMPRSVAAISVTPHVFWEVGVQCAITRDIFILAAYDCTILPLLANQVFLPGFRFSIAVPFRFILFEYNDGK